VPEPSLESDSPREVAAALTAAHPDRGWVDELVRELDRYRGAAELDRLMALWGLSAAELAEVFGVSRQALTRWRTRGVPADRAAAVAAMSRATDLLAHYLKRERIPAVVRRRAPNLDGASLLELAQAGRHDEVAAACRAMFDVAAAHA
jgi:transcriptional regulator with XRE-family HTH domain